MPQTTTRISAIGVVIVPVSDQDRALAFYTQKLGFEQRAVESALTARSKDATLADMEKDLAAARASHAEVDAVRATLEQRSAELAKTLEAKAAALQRELEAAKSEPPKSA